MAIYLFPFALSASLAVLYQLKLVRLNNQFYALAFIFLSLFSGLRLEVGPDTPDYINYFKNLDLSADIFDPENSDLKRFEIGYYLINFFVKLVGGSYSVIFLASSFLLSFSIYQLTKRFSVNRFYVLAIYIGYTFLILNFAQVRQAFAVAFFLLGCDLYICGKSRFKAMMMAMIGLLFQFSALIYIVLFIGVMFWPKRRRKVKVIASVFFGCIFLYTLSFVTDFYTIVALLSNASVSEKVAVYKELQEKQSGGTLIYAIYLIFLLGYIVRYGAMVDKRHEFIIQYTIASILLTLLFIFIFSGSYVAYSRVYIVACLFHGFSLALIFKKANGFRHGFVFMITIVVAFAYNYRILSINEEFFMPYRAVVSLAENGMPSQCVINLRRFALV